MKKKVLVFAFIAVSGIVAIVSSNTNVFRGNEAEASCEILKNDEVLFKCKGIGHCSVSGKGATLTCWARYRQE